MFLLSATEQNSSSFFAADKIVINYAKAGIEFTSGSL